jgi:hypothetical protein
MPTDAQLRTQIRQELQRAGLVKRETKEYLLQKLDGLKTVQLKGILGTLAQVKEKQQEILMKIALKKNPNLVKDMQRIVNKEVQKANHKKEALERSNESTSIDAELEAELQEKLVS